MLIVANTSQVAAFAGICLLRAWRMRQNEVLGHPLYAPRW